MSNINMFFIRDVRRHPVGVGVVRSVDGFVELAVSVCAKTDLSKFDRNRGTGLALQRLLREGPPNWPAIQLGFDKRPIVRQDRLGQLISEADDIDARLGSLGAIEVGPLRDFIAKAIERAGVPTGTITELGLDVGQQVMAFLACERYARQGRGVVK